LAVDAVIVVSRMCFPYCLDGFVLPTRIAANFFVSTGKYFRSPRDERVELGKCSGAWHCYLHATTASQ